MDKTFINDFFKVPFWNIYNLTGHKYIFEYIGRFKFCYIQDDFKIYEEIERVTWGKTNINFIMNIFKIMLTFHDWHEVGSFYAVVKNKRISV